MASSFLALTILSEVGVPQALYRILPEDAFRKERSKLVAAIRIALTIGLAMGLACFLVLFLLSDWIAARYFPGFVALGLVLKIFGASMFLLTIQDILVAVMHGFKHVEIEAVSRNVIENVVRLLFIAAAVYMGWGIIRLSIAYAAAELVAVAASLYLVNRYVSPGGRRGANRRTGPRYWGGCCSSRCP